MNKLGQQHIMINLLFLFLTVVSMIALIPAMSDILDIGHQSDSLNCEGYIHNGDANHSLSYNSSLGTNTMACLAIKLYLPYILLFVLVGGVASLLNPPRQEQYY